MPVTPYKDSAEGKKKQVATMFDNISHKYDFLNHFLSLGIDKRWRKKAISILAKEKPANILDAATGTGDFAIAALKTGAEQVVGVDISEGMLSIGRKKLIERGLQDKIRLEKGDSESLVYDNESFSAVTVAFGVRNFENLEKGLSELHRVLRKDGTLVILEFSQPTNIIIKCFYNLYFRFILPFMGKIISKDSSAYTYLPESVEKFPYGQDFLNILQETGFKGLKCIKLTFGVSSIYIGKK
ncbi:MAG: bifunctional demethylmenaquinone methyltransferase/2-methoxy-6-polyprenyl-1,4-benzoquinol methylase UbiE [Cytophagaceae bacterium]